MTKFSKPILMILINLTFGLIGYSQVVDGTILNSKESENDPYIELLKQASISGHKGENDKAIEYLSQAISMRPNESVGYNQRGHQRLKMKNFNGAIEDFTKGIELYSDNKKPFGYLSRGIVKYESEDYLGALEDFQVSISYKPDHGYTYYYLGLTYLKLGNKDKGCESFLIGKNLMDKHSKKSWKANCK
jgi:tetratricopeptide (TPR) repeat protein